MKSTPLTTQRHSTVRSDLCVWCALMPRRMLFLPLCANRRYCKTMALLYELLHHFADAVVNDEVSVHVVRSRRLVNEDQFPVVVKL